MFDEILQMVKEHMGNNPEVASAISSDQADAIHNEIANHISNGVQSQAPAQSTGGGLLSEIESSIGSGGLATSAIAGGLVSSLASKFGLPPSVTGAIAGALPGLMEKYVNKNNAGTPPATS